MPSEAIVIRDSVGIARSFVNRCNFILVFKGWGSGLDCETWEWPLVYVVGYVCGTAVVLGKLARVSGA